MDNWVTGADSAEYGSGKRLQGSHKRSVPDTPVMTELWFESILAPTQTRNWAGEHRACVSLANYDNYPQVNPPVQQIKGFHGWLKMDGVRKPCWATLRFHESNSVISGNPDLNTRGQSAAYKKLIQRR